MRHSLSVPTLLSTSKWNKQQIPHPPKATGFGMTGLGGWLRDWQEQMKVFKPSWN
jgi:hypothetical protein